MSATEPGEGSKPTPLATLTPCDAVEGVRTYPLQRGETTLGRSSGNDIVLPDETVSRRHCRIVTVQPPCMHGKILLLASGTVY